jgi:aconitate hydratase
MSCTAQNPANFGVLQLEYAGADCGPVAVGGRLVVHDVARTLRVGTNVTVDNLAKGTTVRARHRLSPRQVEILLAGGQIPAFQARS